MSMMTVFPSLLTASSAPAGLMLPAYPLKLPNTAFSTPGPCACIWVTSELAISDCQVCQHRPLVSVQGILLLKRYS